MAILGYCIICIFFPHSNGLPPGAWEGLNYWRQGTDTSEMGLGVDVGDCASEIWLLMTTNWLVMTTPWLVMTTPWLVMTTPWLVMTTYAKEKAWHTNYFGYKNLHCIHFVKIRIQLTIYLKIKIRIQLTIYLKIKPFFIHKLTTSHYMGYWRSEINYFLFFQHQNY